MNKKLLTGTLAMVMTLSSLTPDAEGALSNVSGPATRTPVQRSSVDQAPLMTSQFVANEWYSLERSVMVRPFEVVNQEGEVDVTMSGQVFTLEKGTDFTVVEVKGRGDRLVIGFNLEGQDNLEENRLPMQIEVEARELMNGRPTFLEFDLLDDSDNDEFASDQELAEAEGEDVMSETDVAGRSRARRSRGGVRAKKKFVIGRGTGRVIRVPSRNGMTYCLAEVRLNSKSICGQTMPVIPRAAIGYDVYRSRGWQPVPADYASAKTCTACFWGGGRLDCRGGACGHTALKLPNGLWIGAGIRAYPALPNQNGCSYKRTRRGTRKVCRVPYSSPRCLLAPGH